ncbi:MAG: hypothetical protein BV457_09525 [Thermoplasmata archaeon M9B1D]|nr:MAG: hypothetical protein BV457_09525 [Thermoplasmata archaeon M9B1D]
MKKKILFGSIFSICIIMLVNTSSAVECKTVTDYNKCLLESQLDKLNNLIEKIRQTFEDIQINSISDTSSNDIKEIHDQLSDLEILILGDTSLPTCILGILGFILSLLLSLIGTIFGIIFGPLLALFVRILTAPAVLLAKLIAFIINIFLP